ncbi:hypothetical protein AB4Y43_08155 [Paraburkholderia sp. BR10872]|uniref:hypothetical protein n=1 Tax=Paraburkholderia sp. BR10872 TaxID=3236989 RepID=UPI0034D2A9F5
MLTNPITPKRFQLIARQHLQVIQRLRTIGHRKPAHGDLLKVHKAGNPGPIDEGSAVGTFEVKSGGWER